ncbi:hypothetical protein BDF19DRAFT_158159 [Syncephalis fuscata]|nr:hypothetical protein BDF19DRAFT_158159 [Syncephalis fuscata]
MWISKVIIVFCLLAGAVFASPVGGNSKALTMSRFRILKQQGYSLTSERLQKIKKMREPLTPDSYKDCQIKRTFYRQF